MEEQDKGGSVFRFLFKNNSNINNNKSYLQHAGMFNKQIILCKIHSYAILWFPFCFCWPTLYIWRMSVALLPLWFTLYRERSKAADIHEVVQRQWQLFLNLNLTRFMSWLLKLQVKRLYIQDCDLLCCSAPGWLLRWSGANLMSWIFLAMAPCGLKLDA